MTPVRPVFARSETVGAPPRMLGSPADGAEGSSITGILYQNTCSVTSADANLPGPQDLAGLVCPVSRRERNPTCCGPTYGSFLKTKGRNKNHLSTVALLLPSTMSARPLGTMTSAVFLKYPREFREPRTV